MLLGLIRFLLRKLVPGGDGPSRELFQSGDRIFFPSRELSSRIPGESFPVGKWDLTQLEYHGTGSILTE